MSLFLTLEEGPSGPCLLPTPTGLSRHPASSTSGALREWLPYPDPVPPPAPSLSRPLWTRFLRPQNGTVRYGLQGSWEG